MSFKDTCEFDSKDTEVARLSTQKDFVALTQKDSFNFHGEHIKVGYYVTAQINGKTEYHDFETYIAAVTHYRYYVKEAIKRDNILCDILH
jgi:hypothetical protein